MENPKAKFEKEDEMLAAERAQSKARRNLQQTSKKVEKLTSEQIAKIAKACEVNSLRDVAHQFQISKKTAAVAYLVGAR